MRKRSFGGEAEKCRRQAEQFAGRPEAPFLLRVARSFEELESAPRLRGDGVSCGEPRPARVRRDSRGRQ
jgi:hypothetical protein